MIAGTFLMIHASHISFNTFGSCIYPSSRSAIVSLLCDVSVWIDTEIQLSAHCFHWWFKIDFAERFIVDHPLPITLWIRVNADAKRKCSCTLRSWRQTKQHQSCSEKKTTKRKNTTPTGERGWLAPLWAPAHPATRSSTPRTKAASTGDRSNIRSFSQKKNLYHAN